MSEDAEAQLALANLLQGGVIAQMVATLSKLGIPALLGRSEKSASELAQALDLQVEPTYRLLRGLTLFGLLEESAGQRFALTAFGQPLLPDAPNSLHPLAVLMGQPWHASTFFELASCLRHGKSAFETTHGAPMFEWLARHPRETAIFASAMEGFSAPEIEIILASWEFGSAKRIADIGGGSGKLLAAILRAHPAVQGVLFDQELVMDEARALLKREGVFERCQLAAGDFFAALPTGCDTYLLKHVLHDWGDDKARLILQQVAKAMTPSSKLLVIEQVMSGEPGPEPAKFLDVYMLALTEGGRERTRAEHEALLESAGLRLERLIPTASPLRLIEARRAR